MSDELSKRQRDSIEALSILLKACKEENIEFFLLAGSCLGAVRHKGMIPWDDDIDIGLKLEEYEKLQKVLPHILEGTDFAFKDCDSHPEFPRMYGKVLKGEHGVIDVFKLVPVPKSPISQRVHWFRKRLWAGMRTRKLWHPAQFPSKKARVKYEMKQLVAKPMSQLFSPQYLTNKLKSIERQYLGCETGLFSNFYSVYSRKRELIKAEWLKHPSSVIFESMECPTVFDTDAYLTKLYGEYMTLPPEDKRVPRHLHNRFES